MEKWYSAQVLAGKQGMPKTVSGVVRKAKREGWLAKYSDGQGGGLEYHYNALPEATRDTLYHQHSNTLPVPSCTDLVATEEIKVDLTSLKKWQRDIFAARLALYREFERLLELHGYTRAVDKLVMSAKTGTLPEHLQKMVSQANARKGKARTISASMVKGWHRAVKRNGITALAPKPARKDRVPGWALYFNKIYGRPQKPSLAEAMRELETILPENIKLPSYHQVRRYHQKRSRLEREKGRHGGSAMKRFKGFIRRSTDNLLPLDVVQCDGHSFKSKVGNPFHGKPFKPEVCSVIDVKTKLALGYSAGLAESSQTVADALRHAMTVNDKKPWGGVPAILDSDRGAGLLAHVLGDEVTGVLARAGVHHHKGLPGNPQGRGLVEKTNQSLWIMAARKLETFVGSGMDEQAKRKKYLQHQKELRMIGSTRLTDLPTWAEFIKICDQALRDYNNRPHSGLPKVRDSHTQRVRYMTPLEAWYSAINDGWRPTLLDANILDDLFRPQTIRKTIRNEVSLFGNRYYDVALEHYNNDKVIVEYDIHDVESVRVRDMEHRLICVAQLNRNRRDFMAVPVIKQKRNQRARGRKKLLEQHLEDVQLELTGQIVDADTADFLIEADPGAVDRLMLTSGNQDIQMIQHDQIPAEAIVPEQIKSQKQKVKIHQMVSTESERFNLLHGELRADPRPLTHDECKFLNEYYQKEGGRLYLEMVGDLRQEYGVAEEGNEATL